MSGDGKTVMIDNGEGRNARSKKVELRVALHRLIRNHEALYMRLFDLWKELILCCEKE